MRVMKHNDIVIRSINAFKKYNDVLTDIIEETSVWRKPVGCVEQIFCGTFVAKVYVGQQIKGTYKFDCTDFNAKRIPDNARVRLTKVA
ncbi:MAG: hypothetical protein II502_01275 [Paludibacteraceae bacterium]|nr:hypothetical protein [Paludibacteraceae bacterium]